MKILIIYNPFAGKKKNKNRQIQNLCQKTGVDYLWLDLSAGGFSNFKPGNFSRIFAAGGDGTVRETASWLISQKSSVPLAIIPLGSANILASSLGIPLSPEKALKFGLTGEAKKIDAGLINNKEYFLIAASCGFDASVIKNTPRKMKKAWGFTAYIFSLVYSFFSTKANKFFLKIDEKPHTFTAQSVFISNYAKFFKLKLNPDSKINDGFLSVSILKTLNIQDLGIVIYKLLMGDYQKDWRYEIFKAKSVYVFPFNRKAPKQADGDILELPYMDIKIIPEALNIIANKLP